jgi:hypothetical protein
VPVGGDVGAADPCLGPDDPDGSDHRPNDLLVLGKACQTACGALALWRCRAGCWQPLALRWRTQDVKPCLSAPSAASRSRQIDPDHRRFAKVFGGWRPSACQTGGVASVRASICWADPPFSFADLRQQKARNIRT